MARRRGHRSCIAALCFMPHKGYNSLMRGACRGNIPKAHRSAVQFNRVWGRLRAVKTPNSFGNTMKPSRMQYWFAQGWPGRTWFTVIPLLLVLAAVRACEPTPALLLNWRCLLQFVGLVLLSLLLAFFSAILVGWPILGPIYYDRGLKNGAPFHEGDLVRISAGPHRDRIVGVCELWASRDQVRVELGEKEKEEVKDVLSFTQICREQDAEQTHGRSTSEFTPSADSEASHV